MVVFDNMFDNIFGTIFDNMFSKAPALRSSSLLSHEESCARDAAKEPSRHKLRSSCEAPVFMIPASCVTDHIYVKMITPNPD